MSIKGIAELLPELRAERGWSRERLSHEAFAIDHDGTSAAQIAAIERGVRRASARTIQALAQALEVPPARFPEYRLAVARLALDERAFGLDKAIERLDAWDIEPTGISSEKVKELSRQGTLPERAFEKAKETKDRVKREP